MVYALEQCLPALDGDALLDEVAEIRVLLRQPLDDRLKERRKRVRRAIPGWSRSCCRFFIGVECLCRGHRSRSG